MNRSDLRLQLRRHLAEASTDLFDDTLLNTKLERAQIDLAGRYALLQKPVALAFSGPFLALPADFIHLGEDKPKVDGYELNRIDLNDLMMRDPLALSAGSRTGVPTSFVYEESLSLNGSANTLGLWPAGAGTLSFTYAAKPASLFSDADSPWNGKYDSFHELIAMHAANNMQGEQGSSAAANTVFYSIFMRRKEEFSDYLRRGKVGKRIQLKSRLGLGGWQR